MQNIQLLIKDLPDEKDRAMKQDRVNMAPQNISAEKEKEELYAS